MVQRAPPHHQLGRRVTERVLLVRRGPRRAQAQERGQCSIGSYILTPLRKRNVFRLSTSKPKRRRKAFLSSRAKKAVSWRKKAEGAPAPRGHTRAACSAAARQVLGGWWLRIRRGLGSEPHLFYHRC